MTVKFDIRQMIPISDLHRKLGDVIEKVSEDDLLVLKNNKPEFILVAPEKYEELIRASELIEQISIYENIERRRKKSPLTGKQMLEMLKTIDEAAMSHDSDS